MVSVLVYDEVIYNHGYQDHIDRLQTGWMIEHGFGTKLGIKYVGTDGTGEYYVTTCRLIIKSTSST